MNIRKIIREVLTNHIKNLNKPYIVNINGEMFYHQTNCNNIKSIKDNGFKSDLHNGQARFTHGVYFLNHPEGRYGDCTLQANIYGNFLDFRDENDILGDKWINFRDSYEWDNYIDLTIKMRQDNKDIDGLIFDNLLVVWYPEKCIKNISEYNL